MLGVEPPAVVQQGRHAAVVLAALDLTDKNHVVAFFVAAAVEAFEHRRRAHDALQARNTVACSNCGSMRLPHTVCPNCGHHQPHKESR